MYEYQAAPTKVTACTISVLRKKIRTEPTKFSKVMGVENMTILKMIVKMCFMFPATVTVTADVFLVVTKFAIYNNLS